MLILFNLFRNKHLGDDPSGLTRNGNRVGPAAQYGRTGLPPGEFLR